MHRRCTFASKRLACFCFRVENWTDLNGRRWSSKVVTKKKHQKKEKKRKRSSSSGGEEDSTKHSKIEHNSESDSSHLEKRKIRKSRKRKKNEENRQNQQNKIPTKNLNIGKIARQRDCTEKNTDSPETRKRTAMLAEINIGI